MPGYVPAPPPPSGGFAHLIGALVLIDVHAFEPQAVTPFGIKDQCQITVRVVDHPTDPMQVGRSTTTPATNVVLVSQLCNLVGQTTLGRLVYGKQTQGNPPVRLDPPTPADEAKADQFLASHGQQPPAAVPPAAAPPPGYPAPVPAYAGNGAQQPAQPGYTPPPAQPAWQPAPGQPEQPPF